MNATAFIPINNNGTQEELMKQLDVEVVDEVKNFIDKFGFETVAAVMGQYCLRSDQEGENFFVNFYNNLCLAIHKENAAKGFWEKPRSTSELLMLMVTELAEACEGDRKNLMDSHVPQHPNVTVEVVDCNVRIFDFFGGQLINGMPQNAGRAFVDKLKFNRTRPYKHGKKY